MENPAHTYSGTILHKGDIPRQSKESNQDLMISRQQGYHWAKPSDSIFNTNILDEF